MDSFDLRDLSNAFDDLNLPIPSSFSPFLKALAEKRPPEAAKTGVRWKLIQFVRDDFDSQYGRRESTIEVDAMLTGLLPKLNDLHQKEYLDETLRCFRGGAFRATVVMAWNLAYDHLLRYVMDQHLASFNSQLTKSVPNAKIKAISRRDDFGELQEFDVIRVCHSAHIISKSLDALLNEKLKRRNRAAHPSGISVSQLHAEDTIKDLIDNVVLALT
jgi:hypothetical protein